MQQPLQGLGDGGRISFGRGCVQGFNQHWLIAFKIHAVIEHAKGIPCQGLVLQLVFTNFDGQ